MIPLRALLYPQTLPYPIRILKALDFLDTLRVIEIFQTKKIFQEYCPEALNKISFLSFSDLAFSKDFLERILKQLQNFALYLRTPENLKLYQIHQQLFKEDYDLFFREKERVSPWEMAFLTLALAEEVDWLLLEVERGLKEFNKKWREFWEEDLLTEGGEEVFNSLSSKEEKEVLWKSEIRRDALKVLLPYVDFSWSKNINTLLITEVSIVEDLIEGEEIEKEEKLGKDILLIEVKSLLNKKIGLSDLKERIQLNQILYLI